MYVVYNELSGSCFMFNKITKETINEFVHFVKQLRTEYRLEEILYTKKMEEILYDDVDGYSLKDWYADTTVDKIYKQYLRSFLGRCNPCENFEIEGDFQIYIDDKYHSGIGLSKAYETKLPVISLLGNDMWKTEQISGTYQSIVDDKIVNKNGVIKNYNPTYEESKIGNDEVLRTMNEITSGQDLWERREIIFPNLMFCNSVQEQLLEYPEKFHIEQIMNRLMCLQHYFDINHEKFLINDVGYNARSESETVKSNKQLRELRQFILPNGEKKQFYYHIGFYGNFPGRIYFLPDLNKKIFYIGYIGKHLPTKKY